MPKKFLVLIISAALAGGIIGSVFSASSASASFLSDLKDGFNNLFHFLPDAASTVQQPPPSAVVPYAPTVDYEQAVVRAVEIADPSVVSIVISKNLPVIGQCPYEPFGDLPPEFRDFFGGGGTFYKPCSKGTKLQEVGGGSGFIVSSDGLILTNKHVAADSKAAYTVFTNDGKKYEAKILALDPVQDIALIKIDASDLTPVKLGDSDSIKLGQTAIAIGNALGEFRNTVSVGVISGLSRTITASGGGNQEKIEGVLQTDAAINPGNSGGPLLNLKGEVIGINTAIVSGAQNIGFAIPINRAKRSIESVKMTGSIKVPYFGVRYLVVTPELAKSQHLSVDYGALVRGSSDGSAVIAGSPAAKAGVQAEDVILEISGERIDQDHSLSSIIQKYNIGDVITLKVLRGKDTITLSITLEERPDF